MPQGLSLSASLPVALAAFIALGSQRIFCLFSLAVCALGCLMSRGDELRQLAAQISVLAVLEDSIAVGLSRAMGPASPGRAAAPPDAGSPLAPAVPAAAAVSAAAPSPSHEVAASLLRSASLRAASPRTRTRSRSPAPLPKRAPRAPRRSSSVASGLRGSVALAESGLVTGLATKSCPPVPPPQWRLSRVSRALYAASAESQPPAVASGPSAPSAPAFEAPCAAESASNSDDEWDALLDAHGLAPSLGGTAAAVAQPADAAGASRRARDKRRRRQRSALLSLRVPPVWRGYAGGFALGVCMLSRVMSICWSLQSFPAASGFAGFARRHRRWPWVALCTTSLETLRSPTCVAQLPWYVFARKGSSWWPPSLAKRLHRCRICCSWTSLSCSWVWRLQVVS